MKLQGYRADFYTYSGKASDLSRQLAFAGIALIWLFKKDDAGRLSIPPDLVMPGRSWIPGSKQLRINITTGQHRDDDLTFHVEPPASNAARPISLPSSPPGTRRNRAANFLVACPDT